MPHISYVDPGTVEDPELQAIMERAARPAPRVRRAKRSACTSRR